MIVFFALASGAPERYLSAHNLRVVLAQTVIVAIGAIGMTLVIVTGGIDLSVGSVIALTGGRAARSDCGTDGLLWPRSSRRWSRASLVGLVNGLAITRLRVVPFIVTLGMLGIARGVAKWVAEQSTVDAPASWLNELRSPSPRRAGCSSPPGSGSHFSWRW